MKFYLFYNDNFPTVLKKNLKRLKVEYEDIEDEGRHALYNVNEFPTFMAVTDQGKEINRFTGTRAVLGIKSWLERLDE